MSSNGLMWPMVSIKHQSKSHVVSIEHFIVWNQMDTKGEVKRLYGRLNTDLKSDETYVLYVDNRKFLAWPSPYQTLTSHLGYDINIFHGRKLLHFQEINSLGGSNPFLGLIFMAMSGLGVLIMIVFLALYVIKVTNNPEFYEIENTKWWVTN